MEKVSLHDIPTGSIAVPLHRSARDPRHLLGAASTQATVLPAKRYGPRAECERRIAHFQPAVHRGVAQP